MYMCGHKIADLHIYDGKLFSREQQFSINLHRASAIFNGWIQNFFLT